MRKAVALFICFGLLLLAVPNLNAMAINKRTDRFDFKQIIKSSALAFTTMLPFLTPVFGKYESSNQKNYSGNKIRITGGLLAPRVADED